MKFFFILALLAACTKSQRPVAYLMTVEALLASKGQPDQTLMDGAQQTLLYPGGEQYVVEQAKVLRKQWTPQGPKALIQYWRHNLVGEPYTISRAGAVGTLSSPVQGIEVVFDHNSGKVVQVAQYIPRKDDP